MNTLKRTLILMAVWIKGAVMVSSAQTLQDVNVGVLKPLKYSHIQPVDINNDGKMDIFHYGSDGTTYYAVFYLNEGNWVFTLSTTNLPAYSNMYTDWADFDNDGLIDVAITGYSAGQRKCEIYRNQGNFVFSLMPYSFEPLAFGNVSWADLDGDGKIDLIINGSNAQGKAVTRVYKNTGNNFTLINLSLEGITSGSTVCFDFDNDGLTDIFYTGINSYGQKACYLYRNNGNFNFSSVSVIFEKITDGDVAVADVDGNGSLDVFITGSNNNNQRISKLYWNNNGIFSEAAANFDKVSSSSVHLADIDNNGKPDILLSGQNNSNLLSVLLFYNQGNGNFVRNDSLPIGLVFADAAIADFNNDSKVDIFLSGQSYAGNLAKLYRNNWPANNAKPTMPSGISAHTQYNSVTLGWISGNDDLTDSLALLYNVFVGKVPEKTDIWNPMSILDSGKLKIFKPNLLLRKKQLRLDNLPEGRYNWSVQTIDNNGNASQFFPTQQFVICSKPFIGNDTILCVGDTLRLSIGTTTDSVNWYSQKYGLLKANTRQLIHCVNESDEIIAELFNQLGCRLYDTIKIGIYNLPNLFLGNDTDVCDGENILLTIPTQGIQQSKWYSSMHGLLKTDTSAVSIRILATDTIVVWGKDVHTCKNTDTIVIRKKELPTVHLGPDRRVCQNDTAILRLPAIYAAYTWQQLNRTEVVSVVDTCVWRVNKTDTLRVNVTGSNGCQNADTVVLQMLNLPSVTLGPDTAICYGESWNIRALTSANRSQWYSSQRGLLAMDTLTVTYKVLTSDTLSIMVTDSFSCSNADTIVIHKLELPDFSIGNDTAICYGNNLLFSAGTGWKNVDWYSKNMGLLARGSWFYQNIFYQTDSIWAVVTNQNNCVNYDSVFIEVYPLPVLSLGADTSVCRGDSILLTPGSQWPIVQWTIDSVVIESEMLWHKVMHTDTIVVKVTDSRQCFNLDTLRVEVLSLPDFYLPVDTGVCRNDTLQLDIGKKWEHVTWQSLNNIIADTLLGRIVLPVVNSDTLQVVVVDTNRCRTSRYVKIHVFPLPVLHVPDTSICFGQTVAFSLPDTLQRAIWLSVQGDTLEQNEKFLTYSRSVNDSLIVIAFSREGCQSRDSFQIVVHPLPLVEAGNDTIVCYGNMITLGGRPTATGSDPLVYQWDNVGEDEKILPNPQVTLLADTFFRVEVTDAHGCRSFDSVHIYVNPPSVFTLPDTLYLCKGGEANLPQSPIVQGSRFGYTFHWTPDSLLDNPASQWPVFRPASSTTYRVVVQSWKCNPDTAYLPVVVRPLPKIYISPTLTIGQNDFVQLYAEGGVAYHWEPASGLNVTDKPDPIASPKITTTYTVRVTDAYGCSSTDSVKVCVANSVFVPSLFSPNNDGQNDFFTVYGFGILELKVKIFDRNRQLIFESSDWETFSKQGWDGNYKGKPVDPGIYYWWISGKFKDGSPVLFNGKNYGTVTLIR